MKIWAILKTPKESDTPTIVGQTAKDPTVGSVSKITKQVTGEKVKHILKVEGDLTTGVTDNYFVDFIGKEELKDPSSIPL